MTKVIPGPPYPGVYQHYKGDLYVVHKVITDSTNVRSGLIVVLYESLKEQTWHVRNAQEFREDVHKDGTAAIDHHLPREYCFECIPRFRLLDISNYPEEEDFWD